MLSGRTRKALSDELTAKKALRRELDQEIVAIELLLRGVSGKASTIHASAPPVPTAPAGTAKTGLRQMLRDILAENPKQRPMQIAGVLDRAGFKHPAKEKLNVRIANELWRMKKSGQVDKDDKGRYFVPKEAS
jgi:hypothetical protein